MFQYRIFRYIDIDEKKIMFFPTFFDVKVEDCKEDASDGILMYGSRNRKKKIDVMSMKCIIYVKNSGKNHWQLCVVMNPGKVVDSYNYHKIKWTDGETSDDRVDDGFNHNNDAPCVLVFDSMVNRSTDFSGIMHFFEQEVIFQEKFKGKKENLFTTGQVDGKCPFPVIPIKTGKLHILLLLI